MKNNRDSVITDKEFLWGVISIAVFAIIVLFVVCYLQVIFVMDTAIDNALHKSDLVDHRASISEPLRGDEC